MSVVKGWASPLPQLIRQLPPPSTVIKEPMKIGAPDRLVTWQNAKAQILKRAGGFQYHGPALMVH